MCLLMVFLGIALPVLELVLASWLADLVGWGSVLAGLLGFMLIGILVLRGPQRWAWLRVRESLGRGEQAAVPTAKALTIGVSGGLLIFPGFVTAAAGLLLLVPPVTTLVARWMARRYQAQVAAAETAPGGATGYWRMTTVRRTSHAEGTVVEGTVVDRTVVGESSSEPTTQGGPAGEITDGTVVEGTVVEGDVVRRDDETDEPGSSG